MESETFINNEIFYSLPFKTEILLSLLKDSVFERNIIFMDTLGSTNVFIKKLAQNAYPEGTVVIADEQSAGLGRMGRQWFSKKGENLLFSVLLRPKLPPNRIFFLTMIFTLAGIDAIKQMNGLNAVIKWPNDIYMDNKKMGGILTELAVKNGIVQHCILGMGLNVNWNPSKELTVMYPTTSIYAETQETVRREHLLGKILRIFEKYYHEGIEDLNSFDRFYEKWINKSVILGKSVVIETGKEKFKGEAAHIDKHGALTLITEDGHKRKFLCGDVSVKMNFSEH
jgi:BirA family transcriptional regulator, biotin operon repressor / biotin---[acetyl-CoA-carboxylase] ligase